MRRKRFVLLHLYGAACVCCYFRELLRGSTSRHCCKKKPFHWSEWSCRNSLSIWLWSKSSPRLPDCVHLILVCSAPLYGAPFPSCLCWFVCVISLVRALVHPVVLVPALLQESSLVAGSSDLTVIWGFKNYHPQGQAWGCLSRYLVPVSLRVWSYPFSPTSLFSGCVPCPIVWTDCLPRPFVYPLLLINYIPHVHSASGSFLDKP